MTGLGWPGAGLVLVGARPCARAVREGKVRAVGPIVGAVLRAARGRADARDVRERLLRLVREPGDP